MKRIQSFLRICTIFTIGLLGLSAGSMQAEEESQQAEDTQELARTACACALDTCIVTAFRGNLAVDPCRKLLTNFIDPVQSGDTTFEQDTGTEAITCFSGNVGLNECRSLLVNRICPVMDTTLDVACAICDADDRGCVENALGCLELCGDQVIVPGTMLVNEFGPFDCPTMGPDGIMQPASPVRFNVGVEVNHDLSVEGDLVLDGSLISNGQNISQLVAYLMAEVKELRALLEEQ